MTGAWRSGGGQVRRARAGFGWQGSGRVIAYRVGSGRLSCPAPIQPRESRQSEGADLGVFLFLQPPWLPGLPGRVGRLDPHLASRLSCDLSRTSPGHSPRGGPAAGALSPQALSSVLVTLADICRSAPVLPGRDEPASRRPAPASPRAALRVTGQSAILPRWRPRPRHPFRRPRHRMR
jgi:hypothetical protein